MLKKIYLALCILVVALAIFVLIGGKIKSFGRIFLATTDKKGVSYGDLYTIGEIDAFRFPITGVSSNEKDTIDSAKVIAMGDSFLGIKFGSKVLPNELEDDIKLPVYGVPVTIEDPLKYLESIHYQKGAKKIIIVESVEREVVSRALSYGTPAATASADWSLKKEIDDIDYAIFDMTDVDYFFKHNIFINPVRLFLKNLNFSLLGRMDSRIGAYSLQPPMLFYFEEVNFDKNLHNTELAPKVADNIKKLANTLQQKYNLEMIYVVIPNKYTIYNDLDKQGSYNGFMPRLQTELAKRQINYVDLYSDYMANRNGSQLLYYPNDSHFTPWGKKILADELTKKIKKITGTSKNSSPE